MKKPYLTSLLFLFLLAFGFNSTFAASNLEEGVKQLADQIGKSMLEKQKQKIAIIDFSDLNGNVTALGQFMAEELTTQLFMIAPGKFEVVERRQLLKLEEELTLGQTGFIEEKSIKKMGQVLGVDAIVTGSMTDLGNTVKINARLIGVDSAKVFAVAATDIPKTGMVADLIAKQVEGRQAAIQNKPKGNAPVKQEAKGTEKVFQNDLLKVTVKGFKKSKSSAALTLIFENVMEDGGSYGIAMGAVSINPIANAPDIQKSEIYLLDDNGERWNFAEDTSGVSPKRFQWKELISNSKLVSKLTFIPGGESNGKVFSFVSKFLVGYVGDDKKNKYIPFTIVINDIPVE